MTGKKPDTVGSFLGLITRGGRLRLQMRTESGSPITGLSYKGDFELTGGAVKEKDLRRVLTFEGLFDDAIREAEEELGIVVIDSYYSPYLFRTMYDDPKTGKIDWAFMIPVLPDFWDETGKMKRKTADVDPDQLNVLGELNLIVSGKKRMWRMGEAAIYMGSANTDWRRRAAGLLTEVKPDWRVTEFFTDAREDLAEIRRDLGLEVNPS